MTGGVEVDPPRTNSRTKPEHVDSATVYEMKRLQLLSDNVFLVIATATVNRIARISRNMVVLRHHHHHQYHHRASKNTKRGTSGGELTLINPIRLDEASEQRLLRLGRSIERIIRLAPRHGMRHDQYYLEKFPNVRRWAPAAAPACPGSPLSSSKSEDSNSKNHQLLPVHRLFTPDDDNVAILPACHVFCFQETAEPECALFLLSEWYVGNVLVTANALQCHTENPYINMPVRTKLAASGMTTSRVVIPPNWIKRQISSMATSTAAPTTTSTLPLTLSSSLSSIREQKRAALRWDFEMLLRLDFDRLVGSSGMLLLQEAKEQAVMTVEQTFPLM
jgi:hypothetical protein